MSLPEQICIKVLQEDIDAGVPSDNLKCPIARAANRFFGKPIHVGTSILYPDLSPWDAELPDEAMEFVRKFDNREPVEPFEFCIKIVTYDK
jgi:hypothetical protein